MPLLVWGAVVSLVTGVFPILPQFTLSSSEGVAVALLKSSVRRRWSVKLSGEEVLQDSIVLGGCATHLARPGRDPLGQRVWV